MKNAKMNISGSESLWPPLSWRSRWCCGCGDGRDIVPVGWSDASGSLWLGQYASSNGTFCILDHQSPCVSQLQSTLFCHLKRFNYGLQNAIHTPWLHLNYKISSAFWGSMFTRVRLNTLHCKIAQTQLLCWDFCVYHPYYKKMTLVILCRKSNNKWYWFCPSIPMFTK